MGTNSGIEYVHHSWNPWRGCQPESEGCDHCYMQRDAKRFGWDPTVVTKCGNNAFYAPTMKPWKAGERIFVCSWSDFFHPDADLWRPEAWNQIRRRSDLTFLIVTKRIDFARARLPESWGSGWPNVWIIASTENQHWLDERMCWLRGIKSVVRGISYEPALGPIDISKHAQFIDWVVAGCESGGGRREAEAGWFRSLRDQCASFGIPFFLKQMDVDGKLVKMPELDGAVYDQLPGGIT